MSSRNNAATSKRKRTVSSFLPPWLSQRLLISAISAYALVSLFFLVTLHQRADQTLTTESTNRHSPIVNNAKVSRVQQKLPHQQHKPLTKEQPAVIALDEPVISKSDETTAFKQASNLDNLSNTWSFDREAAEKRLRTLGAASIRQPITAFIEPSHSKETIISMGHRGNMKNEKDPGEPPVYVSPLPLRTQRPQDLRQVTYPAVQTCQDMPAKFPVDRGLQMDPNTGDPIVWNVGDNPTPPDFDMQELPYCPVEADPFLPWIHDLFPSPDGSVVHFLAQNKRRCRTGQKFTEDVNRLLPQVSLMQTVSVERLTESQARQLAPSLWHADDKESKSQSSSSFSSPRYRLAPFAESAPDGKYTRFLCRFHTMDFGTGQPVLLNETLSTYPFNYELAAYRKGHNNLHTPKGKDSKFFWTSNLHFTCPVPKPLQNLVATGATILSDGTPTLWLDIVPIRTPPRYEEMHLDTDVIGPYNEWAGVRPFNATQQWGKAHVLPAVEASGRWANLPICPPPTATENPSESNNHDDNLEKAKKPADSDENVSSEKPHYLSACLWASAEFKTRGQRKGAISDTVQRLYEWLTFHFMVGFDHVYVYDNSGAHTNATNLEPILKLFGDKVTRIEWPAMVCNNNIPAHDSTGERSSQYAAENSCRTRYGPFSEWIAAFDTDEYFAPMGDYTDLKHVLRDAASHGANILSFRSSRGRLRREASEHVEEGRVQLENTTFLEAYNCDSAGSPKPNWADRARKQIYRPDYVLYHYVHYSTVTVGHTITYAQGQKAHRYAERAPSERVVDEMKEAVMVHTKTITQEQTNFYLKRCRNDYPKKWQGCWVAYPWPHDKTEKQNEDPDGMEYNCFINRRVEDYWVPKLRKALESAPLE